MTSNQFFEVFEKSILDYHVYDSIEQQAKNPYNKEDFKFLLYQKNWIDTGSMALRRHNKRPRN
jgi:hypothetical protein